MREILDELLDNWSAGEPVALATVVSTFRSSPRLPGAAMMVTASGDVLGSVSGGCVEGDVYDCAQQVLATGDTTVRRYGLTDEDVGAIGLTCGGLLDVFIERIDPLTFPEFGEIATSIRTGRPVAVAVVIEHPEPATVGRRLVIRPADTSGPTASAPWDRPRSTGSSSTMLSRSWPPVKTGHWPTARTGSDARRASESLSGRSSRRRA